MAQLRYACFTGYEEDPPTFDPAIHQYLIYGKETCPTTGRIHWQGYVEYKSRTAFKKAQASLGQGRCHMEARKGTQQQAVEYCKKDKCFEQHGTLAEKHQGCRTDLEEYRDIVKSGATDRDLVKHHISTFARYPQLANKIRDVYEEKRNWVPEVVWLHGEPGTGKSRRAYEAGAVSVTYHNGFFLGYNGEDVVLFDDFDLKAYPRQLLLQLLDRYPMNINIKNGQRNWKPRVIFITTNHAPEIDFTQEPALRRRVTTTEEFTSPVAKA